MAAERWVVECYEYVSVHKSRDVAVAQVASISECHDEHVIAPFDLGNARHRAAWRR